MTLLQLGVNIKDKGVDCATTCPKKNRTSVTSEYVGNHSMKKDIKIDNRTFALWWRIAFFEFQT